MATVFGAQNNTTGDTITVGLKAGTDLSGDADEINLAVSNVSNGDVNFAFTGNNTAFEVANLTTVGDSDDGVDFTAYTGLETLNVAGEGDIELSVGAANAALTTINAADNKGGVTVDATGVAAIESVTTGEGADEITVGGALTAETVAIDAGAGADKINFALDNTAANAVAITGGEGGDVFTLTNSTGTDGNLNAAGTVASNTELTESLVSIADFDAANDTLDISDFGGTFVADNTVQSAVDAAAQGATSFDLADAVAAAAGSKTTASANNDAFAFNFEDNTYIAVDVDADTNVGIGPGDILIELQGVSTSDLGAANYVA